MDIRCESCGTEYEVELDPARLPPSGWTMKCDDCGHAITVRPPASPAVSSAPAPTAPQPVVPVSPALVLRLLRDGVPPQDLPVPDLTTVALWASEGRLLPVDQVSVGGAPFVAVTSLPEVAAHLPAWGVLPATGDAVPVKVTAEVEALPTINSFKVPSPGNPVSLDSLPPLVSSEPTVRVKVSSAGGRVTGVSTPNASSRAAAAAGTVVLPPARSVSDAAEEAAPKGRGLGLLAAAGGAAVLAGGVVWMLLGRDTQPIAAPAPAPAAQTAPAVVAPSPPVDAIREQEAQLAEARAGYLTDVLSDFPRVDAQLAALAAAPEPVGSASVATRVHLQAAWADQLAWLADEEDASASRVTKDGQVKGGVQAAERATRARAEASTHVRTGLDLAVRLVKDHPGPTASLAHADVLRAGAAAAEAKAVLDGQVGDSPELQALRAAVLGLDKGQRAAAAQQLNAVAGQTEGVRAWVWLAELHRLLSQGDALAADIQAIETRSPRHERVRAFRALAPVAPAPAVDALGGPAGGVTGATQTAESKAVVPAKTEPAKTVNAAKAEPAKAEKAEPVKAGVDVDQLLAKANGLLSKGKAAAALPLFDQAIASGPSNTEALYGKALALFDLERVDQAIGTAQKTLKINPRFSDAMIVLAEGYKSKGMNAEALNWYQKYLDVTPDGEQASVARTNIERLR